MKKILLSSIFILLVLQGISQQSFRLHVQPGKPQLAGDGDDYTTLVITARDKEGEVITSVDGKVTVRVSAGFCEAIEVNMQDGVALVKYTSPMFGTPIKASQRMVYFMFRFMQKFTARSGGSTDAAANQKLATEITIESFKEGLIPVTLIPKKDGDNFAYIVCEMNGVKGKAKIEILKASEGRNGSIVPGVYYGRDITGQSDWTLNIYSSGTGTFGEANSPEDDYNTIMFSNEVFTEMNDVFGKTAGMTGFMKAYLGPSWKETQYIKDYDIVKMGMGSAYMPMPNNSVFLYAPPVLFDYQGRPAASSPGSTAGGKPEDVLKTDKSGIILSQNEIIGDGKSRTKAVFHYQDENGIPVSGKSISWSIPKGIKQISVQTITDANGNAETVLEAPVIKATGETRGENTGQIIDNYDLFKITANYSSPKRANDYTEAYLCIFKTIERNVRILKPGFEAKSFKLLLPQLENFKLESSVFAFVEMMNSPSVPDKLPVNDAIIFIERKKFDEEYYNRNYELYFKKDRKLFLNMVDDEKGGFYAITSSEGKFALNVGVNPDKKLSMEPLQAKLSDLTGRRKGSLAKALANFKNIDFTQRMLTELINLDKSLCSEQHVKASFVEEKLHILGNLMTNLNNASGMVKETTGEMYDACWEAVGVVASFVNDEYKITEGLSKASGLEGLQDKAGTYGAEKIKVYLEKYGGTKITGTLKGKIYQQLYKRIFALSDKGKIKGVEFYYKSMGESVNNGISELLSDYIEAISDWAEKWISKNIADPKGYFESRVQDVYYGKIENDITRYMAADPAKVHAVYDKLQPLLIDRSAELGKLYSDVGKFRMDMGYYKADKDLFADLSKGAVIIGTVLVTRDYARMVDLIDKIDKGSKAIDGLMAANNLYQEYGNYCAMLFNVKGCFTLASKSIAAGTIITTEQIPQPGKSFSIFPSAFAINPPTGNSDQLNFKTVNEKSIVSGETQLPVDQLPLLIDNADNIDNWISANKNFMVSIAEKSPKVVSAFMKNAVEYENHLFNLLSLAVVNAGNSNPALAAKWDDEARKITSNSIVINSEGSKIIAIAAEIPKTTTLTLEENKQSGTGKFYFENRKLLIIIGLSVGVMILVIVSLIIVKRKKKVKQTKPLPQFVSTPTQPQPVQSPVVNPIVTQATKPSQISSQPSNSLTPKFCPQCGAPFVANKKFCGKCGYKISV